MIDVDLLLQHTSLIVIVIPVLAQSVSYYRIELMENVTCPDWYIYVITCLLTYLPVHKLAIDIPASIMYPSSNVAFVAQDQSSVRQETNFGTIYIHTKTLSDQ